MVGLKFGDSFNVFWNGIVRCHSTQTIIASGIKRLACNSKNVSRRELSRGSQARRSQQPVTRWTVTDTEG